MSDPPADNDVWKTNEEGNAEREAHCGVREGGKETIHKYTVGLRLHHVREEGLGSPEKDC